MIYILLGIGLFLVLVWAGRRARPFLIRRELRIVTAALGLALMIAGGVLSARGGYVLGGIMGSIGLAMIFSSRTGMAHPSPGTQPPPRPADMGDSEARDILGVGPRATKAEIQAAYARLIRAVHPDAGGTTGLAARLNAARDLLLKK